MTQQLQVINTHVTYNMLSNVYCIAVRVSIKPSSSTVPLVKQVRIEYNDKGMSGKQPEVLSDPSPKPSEKQYSIPERSQEVL